MTVLRSTMVAFAARCARPRQRQQAVDDLGGAERLTLDLLEQHRARIRRVGVLEQHLRVARNAGERRVHFVRDAGREQADRRHLLGNLQLLFEPHVIGDVLEQQNRADDGAGTGQALQRDRRRIHQQDVPRFGRRRCGRAAGRQRHLEERRAARILATRGRAAPRRTARRTRRRACGRPPSPRVTP